MSHDVFVSHASVNKPVADAVCATLEGMHIRCWIAPRDVSPGTPYPEAIEGAVAGARAMVLVFSNAAAESADVRSEIHLAFRRELPVIPLALERVRLRKGLDYWLGSIHWLDAMTPPLEAHLRTLAVRVRELLDLREPERAHKADRSADPTARGHHDRGVACYHGKDYEGAIRELSEAIRLDPSVAWAFNDRGAAHLHDGDLERALADYTEGIRLDPSLAWPLVDRASIHLKRGHWDSAIADYTRALTRDPTIAWAHHDRGIAYLERGDAHSAVDDFTRTIQLAPNLVWGYRNRARAYSAMGEGELAKRDEALAALLEG